MKIHVIPAFRVLSDILGWPAGWFEDTDSTCSTLAQLRSTFSSCSLMPDVISGLGHGMKRSFPRADRSQIPSPGECGSPRTALGLLDSQSRDNRCRAQVGGKPHYRRSSMISRLRWPATQVESALSTSPFRQFKLFKLKACRLSCRTRGALDNAALQFADPSFLLGRDPIDVLTPDKARAAAGRHENTSNSPKNGGPC